MELTNNREGYTMIPTVMVPLEEIESEAYPNYRYWVNTYDLSRSLGVKEPYFRWIKRLVYKFEPVFELSKMDNPAGKGRDIRVYWIPYSEKLLHNRDKTDRVMNKLKSDFLNVFEAIERRKRVKLKFYIQEEN